MRTLCVDTVFAPLSLDDFKTRYWGKHFYHARGLKGRFSSLLPWDTLNVILAEHRLDYPRLRLAKDGEAPSPSMNSVINRETSRRGATIPRLDSIALNQALCDGSTLVIDAVDEMAAKVRALASELERVFHERIQVNAYAGFGTSRGFDLHWDDHDVIVLQVSGAKRWAIHGVTRQYPLYRDSEFEAAGPSNAIWQDNLVDGDLLYIPRGWWHVATAIGEPTLHLTFGISNRTGIDLLAWIQDRLRASPLFRQDLPRFADEAERHAQLRSMRRELSNTFDDDVLTKFFAHWDATAVARPQLSLPWSAMPAGLPPSDDTRLVLTVPRDIRLMIAEDQETVVFETMGKRWEFARAAEGVLRSLMNGSAVSIGSICRQAQPTLSPDDVRRFLNEFFTTGLIAISPARDALPT